MKTTEVRKELEASLHEKNWRTTWDKDQEKIRVHLPLADKPVEISVPQLIQRLKHERRSQEQVIRETVKQIQIVHDSMEQKQKLNLTEREQLIFPVMRSASFPTETADGNKLVFEDHTAESRIYFAVDLGKSYALIDEHMLSEAGWQPQELKEKALFNLRGLTQTAKLDVVQDNHFYFISPKDGYAASRILNAPLLQAYAQKAKGDFCLSIPHQDVLILADLRNDNGYDVLGQMTMHFYRHGDMPITPLPFQYKGSTLEPIFILAKRRPGK